MYLKLTAVALVASLALIGCKEETKTNVDVDVSKITDTKDKFSYIVGFDIGQNLTSQGMNVNKDIFLSAINDALAEKKSPYSQEEMMQIAQEYQKVMMEEQQALAEKNKGEGEKFLAENAKKEGIKTTDSGLQYQLISEAKPDAATPTENDVVKVHYHGTLTDGTVFDSSVERGEPVEFPVKGVIPGWQEGLQLIHQGEKVKLFIPSSLAYGDRGAGAKIPGNSALIFEVELLEINPKAKTAEEKTTEAAQPTTEQPATEEKAEAVQSTEAAK